MAEPRLPEYKTRHSLQEEWERYASKAREPAQPSTRSKSHKGEHGNKVDIFDYLYNTRSICPRPKQEPCQGVENRSNNKYYIHKVLKMGRQIYDVADCKDAFDLVIHFYKEAGIWDEDALRQELRIEEVKQTSAKRDLKHPEAYKLNLEEGVILERTAVILSDIKERLVALIARVVADPTSIRWPELKLFIVSLFTQYDKHIRNAQDMSTDAEAYLKSYVAAKESAEDIIKAIDAYHTDLLKVFWTPCMFERVSNAIQHYNRYRVEEARDEELVQETREPVVRDRDEEDPLVKMYFTQCQKAKEAYEKLMQDKRESEPRFPYSPDISSSQQSFSRLMKAGLTYQGTARTAEELSTLKIARSMKLQEELKSKIMEGYTFQPDLRKTERSYRSLQASINIPADQLVNSKSYILKESYAVAEKEKLDSLIHLSEFASSNQKPSDGMDRTKEVCGEDATSMNAWTLGSESHRQEGENNSLHPEGFLESGWFMESESDESDSAELVCSTKPQPALTASQLGTRARRAKVLIQVNPTTTKSIDIYEDDDIDDICTRFLRDNALCPSLFPIIASKIREQLGG